MTNVRRIDFFSLTWSSEERADYFETAEKGELMEMSNTPSTLHLQLALAPANHELETPPHEFQLQHKAISEPSHINIV